MVLLKDQNDVSQGENKYQIYYLKLLLSETIIYIQSRFFVHSIVIYYLDSFDLF